MKLFKNAMAVLVTTLLTSQALALATENFLCEEGSVELGLTGLACVSCGIQKHVNFMKQPGQLVPTPSERWLGMLAVNSIAYRDLDLKPGFSSSIVKDQVAKNNMLKMVILGVQSYGYCTNDVWPGKISANVRAGITGQEADLTTRRLTEIAKELGFNGNPNGNRRSDAGQNMRHLLDDTAYDQSLMSQKRRAYDARLQNVSRNRQVAGSGLAGCLNSSQKNAEPTDGDSIKLCKSMAASCGISDSFCSQHFGTVNYNPGPVEQKELPLLPGTRTLGAPPTGLGNGTR